MANARDSIRFLLVAAGYAAAFVWLRGAGFSLDSPWFVLAAMVCFLGLAFVARPVVPIRMPGGLRPVRAWEPGLSRRLGVPAFGRLLRDTPLRWLNREVYLRGPGRTAADVRRDLEAAEASHFWAALLVVPYMIRLAVRRDWAALLVVTAAQVLVNLYPILHLRLARHRLTRLLGRASRRQRNSVPTPISE